MTIEQRRYQRRPRFRLAGDKTSTLIKRKILHATRVILRLARVLFNHLRVVIPSEARDLTIGVRSTQITQRDRPACERSFTPFRMTSSFRTARFQKPINKPRQAVIELRFRIVT